MRRILPIRASKLFGCWFELDMEQPSWPEWLSPQLASRNITSEELAVLLQTDAGTVSDWLAGAALPSPHNLGMLVRLLGLETQEVDDRIRAHRANPLQGPPDPFSHGLGRGLVVLSPRGKLCEPLEQPAS